MAVAIKGGYSQLYIKNEFAHSLDRSGLEGLMLEITGMEKGNKTLSAIISTFEALKNYADFGTTLSGTDEVNYQRDERNSANENNTENDEDDLNFNLSYTINLVLPKSDDVAVFNAIFRSLRENLLRK